MKYTVYKSKRSLNSKNPKPVLETDNYNEASKTIEGTKYILVHNIEQEKTMKHLMIFLPVNTIETINDEILVDELETLGYFTELFEKENLLYVQPRIVKTDKKTGDEYLSDASLVDYANVLQALALAVTEARNQIVREVETHIAQRRAHEKTIDVINDPEFTEKTSIDSIFNFYYEQEKENIRWFLQKYDIDFKLTRETGEAKRQEKIRKKRPPRPRCKHCGGLMTIDHNYVTGETRLKCSQCKIPEIKK